MYVYNFVRNLTVKEFLEIGLRLPKYMIKRQVCCFFETQCINKCVCLYKIICSFLFPAIPYDTIR